MDRERSGESPGPGATGLAICSRQGPDRSVWWQTEFVRAAPIEESTEARPPRSQGEIVTDEDGSGAKALVDFLASKKFI